MTDSFRDRLSDYAPGLFALLAAAVLLATPMVAEWEQEAPPEPPAAKVIVERAPLEDHVPGGIMVEAPNGAVLLVSADQVEAIEIVPQEGAVAVEIRTLRGAYRLSYPLAGRSHREAIDGILVEFGAVFAQPLAVVGPQEEIE